MSMRIKIDMTVEVDPAEWEAEYGIEKSRVRDDVRAYIENTVREVNGLIDVTRSTPRRKK